MMSMFQRAVEEAKVMGIGTDWVTYCRSVTQAAGVSSDRCINVRVRTEIFRCMQTFSGNCSEAISSIS